MRSSQERKNLHDKLWDLSNRCRGAVDGWDFKQYIFGMLFYKYLSETFTNYLNSQEQKHDEKFNYESERDEDWNDSTIREDLIVSQGFFLFPGQLFSNILKKRRGNENFELCKEIKRIFRDIENSSLENRESRNNLKGIFDDIDLTSNRLGPEVIDRDNRLEKIMGEIAELDLGGKYEDTNIDVIGEAYEYLTGRFAASAGKAGGEFYTPAEVSRLLVKLAVIDNPKGIKKVYDPACGSGSLLLKFKEELGDQAIKIMGQEINYTTYNLCRMNMYLHGMEYKWFDIAYGDTLMDPCGRFALEKFDAIVSNPPYSIKWEGNKDITMLNDERFNGLLAPNSKADWAFIQHSLYHLSPTGTGVIICFPGIFYRGGKEKAIRESFVKEDVVDAIIHMPGNLFFGASIETCIMVLKKNRTNKDVIFIDASEQFEKVKNRNQLKDKHIEWIVNVYRRREEMEGVSRRVDLEEIKEKDYNLSLNAYVRKKVERVEIDIVALNREIDEAAERINRLRMEIKELIANI